MSGDFEFRLERILELRRLRERQARAAWEEACRARDEGRRALEALQEESQRAREVPARDGAVLGLLAEFLGATERRLQRAREGLRELEAAEARARDALREARQGVRVLERARERRREAHLVREERREQAVLDEAAAVRRRGEEG